MVHPVDVSEFQYLVPCLQACTIGGAAGHYVVDLRERCLQSRIVRAPGACRAYAACRVCRLRRLSQRRVVRVQSLLDLIVEAFKVVLEVYYPCARGPDWRAWIRRATEEVAGYTTYSARCRCRPEDSRRTWSSWSSCSRHAARRQAWSAKSCLRTKATYRVQDGAQRRQLALDAVLLSHELPQ